MPSLRSASRTALGPGISQVTRPLANLVISNVPGGKETMYSNGARLVATYPVTAVPRDAMRRAASAGIGASATAQLANLVISNVPGARQVMYLNGARLVGTYAVPGIAASIGLNVTVSSYADQMDFGFGGNGEAMYSLPDLARHVAAAYEDLITVAAKAGGGPGGRVKQGSSRTRSKSARPVRARK